MANRKTPKVASTTTGAGSTRTALSVKKKAVKDLATGPTDRAVKGGANYTRAISGAL
ncbi:MAG: hypothetical protein U0Q55_13310 [Vicinamibacterales bacterium]